MSAPGHPPCTVLVTGGAGFIGRHLVDLLCSEGHRVLVVTRQRAIAPPLPAGATAVEADFTSGARPTERVSAVFHLAAHISFAAQSYHQMQQVNVEATRALLAWARQREVRDFVYVSTAATCTGPRPTMELATEADQLPPEFRVPAYGYPFTKWQAEQAVREAAGWFERAVTVNPSTVWGSGDRSFNAGYLLKLAGRGALFWAPAGGTNVVSVRDVARGMVAAWQRGRTGARYLLSGENLGYRELFTLVNSTVGRRPPLVTLPRLTYRLGRPVLTRLEKLVDRLGLPQGQVNAQMLENLFSFRCYSNALAREELAWSPTFTAAEMIADAWGYYQRSGLL